MTAELSIPRRTRSFILSPESQHVLVQQSRLVRGAFLRPQHFQQQDRHTQWFVETRTRALGGLFWGFTKLELDEGALSTGKVVLLSARGVLPDGTPFDFPSAHPAPLALDFPADARNEVVYLALPLRRPESLEDALPSDASADLARFTQADEEFLDAAASDSTPNRSKSVTLGCGLSSRTRCRTPSSGLV